MIALYFSRIASAQGVQQFLVAVVVLVGEAPAASWTDRVQETVGEPGGAQRHLEVRDGGLQCLAALS